MSKPLDDLLRASDAIGLMAVKRKWPDPKYPKGRELSLFDRARELAEVWAADGPPASVLRGGSSSTDEADERKEAEGIKRRALAAVDRLARATKLAEEIDLMYRDVTYLTSITRERPEVTEETLAGCRSCARTEMDHGQRIGGHQEPVFHKSKVSGLCRWCAEKLDEYEELPVKACDIRHRFSAKSATMWLQANVKRRPEAPDLPCGTSYTHHGYDTHCHRSLGHEGEHAGLDQHGKRITWSHAVPVKV